MMKSKNKAGRPPLPEDQKRVALIRIGVSKAEKKDFQKAFEESMYPTYRAFILEKTAPSKNVLTPGELHILRECSLDIQAVLEQYKRIGNNFNQFVRIAQTDKKIPEHADLQNILEEFKSLTAATIPLVDLVNKINEQWLLK
ncbi:MAG TPA: hypothetical protein PK772_08030 [Chitinophagaceae bacterium]|nr:hypothetical protein [Chitinophagaceae bacterium]